MTPAEFRTLALRLPGAFESAHMNHPDFRVGKKIFATLGYPERGWAMVKLTAPQQARVVKRNPDVFVPAKGAWGLKGATAVRLGAADPDTVRTLLEAAWANAGAPPTRGKK